MGVASLVAMLSLGVGLQNLASQRLSRSGLFDAILVSSRANFGDFGGGGGRGRGPDGGADGRIPIRWMTTSGSASRKSPK